jgi:hypothetical protein
MAGVRLPTAALTAALGNLTAESAGAAAEVPAQDGVQLKASDGIGYGAVAYKDVLTAATANTLGSINGWLSRVWGVNQP